MSVWRNTGVRGREGDHLSYFTCVDKTGGGVLMVAARVDVASQVTMRWMAEDGVGVET